jgi:hypothetical protein
MPPLGTTDVGAKNSLHFRLSYLMVRQSDKLYNIPIDRLKFSAVLQKFMRRRGVIESLGGFLPVKRIISSE